MEQILPYVIVITLGLVLGWFLSIRKDKRKAYTRVDVVDYETFKKSMRKGSLIDIRKKEIYEKNHIKGARNFSSRFLKNKNQSLVRKDQPVHLYCQNGRTSLKVARKLISRFKKVVVLDGGFNAYLKEQEK